MAMHKPSAQENDYFAREDSDRRRRLAIAHAQQEAAVLQAKLRAQPDLHCPRCGSLMQPRDGGATRTSSCGGCGGIFIDAADLPATGDREGFLTHLLRDLSSRSWR